MFRGDIAELRYYADCFQMIRYLPFAIVDKYVPECVFKQRRGFNQADQLMRLCQ